MVGVAATPVGDVAGVVTRRRTPTLLMESEVEAWDVLLHLGAAVAGVVADVTARVARRREQYKLLQTTVPSVSMSYAARLIASK